MDEENTKWTKEWEASSSPGWAMKGINPYIKKYKDDLTKGMDCVKLFFPMCGDVEDMFWLSELGHDIVGVEISAIAIQKFFNDSNLEYVVTPCGEIKGSLYTSKTGNIRIYCGDFFLFGASIECNFDGIWDRGAFNILDNCDLKTDKRNLKKEYINILKSVMKQDCHVFIELVVSDSTAKSDDMQSFFGEDYLVEDFGLVEKYAPEYDSFPFKGFQFFRISKNNEI
ncbi:probable thiopurine S-methyltransferase [Mytilus edulis]|uniref:probable thiopurine S-methyltransferase n=1 Tax=Mytilus edulis TaxID=6550 RepID=UPI0039EEED90